MALGALLGLLAVAELVARLSAKKTLHVGQATVPVGHAGVTGPTVLLMCAFCLLATVPAGWLRPVPAALTVYLAAVLSLVLFELVTIAGVIALLVVTYRLARAGSLVLAVALGVPFLGLALVLAGTGSGGRTMAVAGAASGLAAAATETRVLAVLLASAIPLATVAALARGAREQSRTHSAAREVSEGMLADHLARGERARIARELHDVVAHHISMIAVQAETARLTTPGLPATGAQRFAAIGDTARAGLTEMRRLLGVLREDAEQDGKTGPEMISRVPASDASRARSTSSVSCASPGCGWRLASALSSAAAASSLSTPSSRRISVSPARAVSPISVNRRAPASGSPGVVSRPVSASTAIIEM